MLTHSAVFSLIGNLNGFRYGMIPSFEIKCTDVEIIGIDYSTQQSRNKDKLGAFSDQTMKSHRSRKNTFWLVKDHVFV